MYSSTFGSVAALSMERLYVCSCLSSRFMCLPTKGTVSDPRPDRLENEHLGNMDQYRITREVPLPYSFDELSHETDMGDEDDNVKSTGSVRSSKSKQK
jgi:hypothetical protein